MFTWLFKHRWYLLNFSLTTLQNKRAVWGSFRIWGKKNSIWVNTSALYCYFLQREEGLILLKRKYTHKLLNTSILIQGIWNAPMSFCHLLDVVVMYLNINVAVPVLIESWLMFRQATPGPCSFMWEKFIVGNGWQSQRGQKRKKKRWRSGRVCLLFGLSHNCS